MVALRWYQQEGVDAAIESINRGGENHPIVVIPTAGGKSYTLCEIINRYLTQHFTEKVLILSHVAEILEQNYESILDYFQEAEGFVGLYSASLGIKEVNKITVAGIQSVYRKPELFEDYTLVIIDECHLINTKDQGMYRDFLSTLNANYIGLTATPFRLGHGYLHKGEDALFTEICYDLSSVDNFNRLVKEGWLAKLVSKRTLTQVDLEGVRTRAGDFHEGDLADKFDNADVNEAIVQEIIKFGKNFKKWLIFAINIEHAEHIGKTLTKYGIPTAVVHSKMEEHRGDIVEGFRKGKYRAVVNVNVLTTGFNVTDIDLIAMLRPTKSPVLHVQSIGRGLRPHPGKECCLVLDFAGNTERLGPINNVEVKQKGDKKGDGEVRLKVCDNCFVYVHPATRTCDNCGYEFPFNVQKDLQQTASSADIVDTGVKEKWVAVKEIRYSIHQKTGQPNSLRVSYQCGLNTFSEWICLQHKGYAKHKAKHWVKRRLSDLCEFPETVDELFKIAKNGFLREPSQILVDSSTRYSSIKKYNFEPELSSEKQGSSEMDDSKQLAF